MLLNPFKLVPAFAALALLCGCARGYEMHLTNGKIVRAASKPKLDEQGWYTYKDAEGKTERVNSLRVRLIQPAGGGKQEQFEFRQ